MANNGEIKVLGFILITQVKFHQNLSMGWQTMAKAIGGDKI